LGRLFSQTWDSTKAAILVVAKEGGFYLCHHRQAPVAIQTRFLRLSGGSGIILEHDCNA